MLSIAADVDTRSAKSAGSYETTLLNIEDAALQKVFWHCEAGVSKDLELRLPDRFVSFQYKRLAAATGFCDMSGDRHSSFLREALKTLLAFLKYTTHTGLRLYFP
jgi:hypothetical protein